MCDTFGSGCFLEMSHVPEGIEQLVDSCFTAPFFDSPADAVAGVGVRQDAGSSTQDALYCGHLFEDVHTIAIVLHHAADAGQMSLGSPQLTDELRPKLRFVLEATDAFQEPPLSHPPWGWDRV